MYVCMQVCMCSLASYTVCTSGSFRFLVHSSHLNVISKSLFTEYLVHVQFHIFVI